MSLKGPLTVLLALDSSDEGEITRVSPQSTKCPFSVLSGALVWAWLFQFQPYSNKLGAIFVWMTCCVSGLDALPRWPHGVEMPSSQRVLGIILCVHGRGTDLLIKHPERSGLVHTSFSKQVSMLWFDLLLGVMCCLAHQRPDTFSPWPIAWLSHFASKSPHSPLFNCLFTKGITQNCHHKNRDVLIKYRTSSYI